MTINKNEMYYTDNKEYVKSAIHTLVDNESLKGGGSWNGGRSEIPLEIAEYEIVRHARIRCGERIHGYFSTVLGNMDGSKKLRYFPKFLSQLYITGSAGVLQALINPGRNNVHIALEFSEIDGVFPSYITPAEYIRLLTEKEEDKHYTIAELFWLSKLATFLNVNTSTFTIVCAEFFEPGHEGIDRLDFKKKYPLNPSTVEGELSIGEIITVQYAAIEELLNRY